MKISISTQDLKSAVTLASNTLGVASDITSHFVFVKDGNGASVMSCSLPRTFSKVPLLGAQVTGEGSFTVEGKRLIQMLGAVTGVVNIEMGDDKNVKFTLPNGQLALTSLDPDSFPSWLSRVDTASQMKDAKVSASILFDTFNSLKSYVSTEESRSELAQLYVDSGKAYACDGFGMSVARSESLDDLSLKIHTKDISPLLKFLKSKESDQVEILKGDQSSFFKAEDGSLFGLMDIPSNYPKTILSYAEAFDWVPQRVWGVKKGSLNTAIKFLRAGADKDDLKVSLTDEGDMLPLKLSMRPSNGRGELSYSLSPASLENPDQAIELFTSPDEKMFVERSRKGETEESFDSFSFNYQYMTRAIESMSSDNIFIGCNRENNKGYMIFKVLQDSGVETVSVVGWMV